MATDLIEHVESILIPHRKDSYLTIGSISVHDNEDIIVRVVDIYYEWIESLLYTVEKEFENAPDVNDYTFKMEVINKIKRKFFPRFSDFQSMLAKGEYFKNENLSELNWWPQDQESSDKQTHHLKPTKEVFALLVNGNKTPSKLEEIIEYKIPVTLSMDEASAHVFFCAQTNAGKSTLLLELAKNIMDKREGSLVLMEPHGDISYDLARLCKNPEDMIYIDPFMNADYSVSINIFDLEDVTQATISMQSSLIVNTFRQILGTEFSVSMQSMLVPIISVLLQIPNSSLYDMVKFLNDKENHELLSYGKNHALLPAHRLFFNTMFSESRFSVSKFSLSSKLNVLLQDSIFSNLLTGRTTVDLKKILNTPGKILIIRLNGSKMMETLDSVGRFIISLIMSVAFQRNDIPIEDRISTHLIIDEASLFIGEGIGTMLEQARKFRLYLFIALQQNSQLPKHIESSVLSNTAIKAVGMNSHRNNTIMHKEINVSMDDLSSLRRKGEFYLKKGTRKAYKFRVSNRLFNKNLYCSHSAFKEIQKKQIEKHYRKIDLYSDIEYADIPHTDIETTKPYSKDTTQTLLQEIKSDDDELLDY